MSAPLDWKEVRTCEPQDFTLGTMLQRYRAIGDRHEGIDAAQGSLDALLELSRKQGLGDAPWPPYYRKKPSRARKRS